MAYGKKSAPKAKKATVKTPKMMMKGKMPMKGMPMMKGGK